MEGPNSSPHNTSPRFDGIRARVPFLFCWRARASVEYLAPNEAKAANIHLAGVDEIKLGKSKVNPLVGEDAAQRDLRFGAILM